MPLLTAFCKTELVCCVMMLMFLLAGCGAPQRFWPQQDIVGSETGAVDGKKMVLIASRNSEFKRQLVDRLHQELAAEGFGQKTIGVTGLSQVEAFDYAAVVIISTCLAWGLDSDVQAFLARQETGENIILVTTSGDGAWLPAPDKPDSYLDAISAASEMTSMDPVVRNVLARIRSLSR